MLVLGLNGFLTGLLIIAFLFICILLILTVLIQRPSGGGLSGAFGSGAGSGQTAFGAKTGDALTIATIIMFVLFLGFAIGLTYASKPSAGPTIPQATPTDAPPTTGTAPPAAPGSDAASNQAPPQSTGAAPAQQPAGEKPPGQPR
jgi:preprotein translocase subunit SecG